MLVNHQIFYWTKGTPLMNAFNITPLTPGIH